MRGLPRIIYFLHFFNSIIQEVNVRLYLDIVARKPVCGGLRTTKAQTSLRIRFLESIICKLATGEISIFYLVSVAKETGLNIALPETPKTGFLATRPIYHVDFKLL